MGFPSNRRCGGLDGPGPSSANRNVELPAENSFIDSVPSFNVAVGSASFAGGRYLVTKKLGEGGKGVVYQARDGVLDRVVAIKLLKQNALDEGNLKRFLSEARILARLTHPNITTIYDIGEESGQHFVVLEYVDGGDLAHALARQPGRRLPFPEVLRIAASVTRALDHAHRAGIVHRDLKPENFMLTSSGDVKLSDFGLATRIAVSGEEAGIIVGTVAYLSPEAALGRAPTPRSDLYSLGAVLYEMAVGRPPFTGDDVQVLYSHIRDPVAPPSSLNSEIPRALESLILRLMAKDPDARPATAAVLLDEFAQMREVPAGRLAAFASPEAPPSAAPGLVGRQKEMARLRDALSQFRNGRGGVLALVGEAGIGKTRIAAELAKLAASEGVTVLSGHATEGQGAPALAPWMEALSGFASAVPPQLLFKLVGTHAATLTRVIPDLPARLGPALPTLPVAQELERFQLFDAVARLLESASREVPLLVSLEDLHWADEASLQLLEYVCRNTAEERILFLGSYRPEDVIRGGPLEKTLYELRRTRRLEELQLARLTEEDVRALVGYALGAGRVDPELTKILFSRAGGNPFFTEELIASLQEEACITVDGGTASWCGGAVRLPKTVRHVVQRRCARLSKPTQDLLRRASILGREIRPEALARTADVDRDAMVELVEEALSSGLLREEPHGSETRLVFADPQVLDCLYQEISQMRRQRYHERAAEVLASIPGTTSDELAHHYSMAGLSEPARRYLEAAGDDSAELGSCERAAERYERALSFWPKEERAAQRRLLLKLGDAYFNGGKWSWAQESFLEARGIVERPEEDVPISIRISPTLWYLGDVGGARAELEKALRILGPSETDEAAAALNWLATIRLDEGDPDGSAQAAEKALEIAKRTGDQTELEFALNNLGWTEAVRGRWELGIVYILQELELHAGGGVPYDYANSLDDAATYYTLFLPDYPKALGYAEKAVEIARRIGNRPAEVRWRLHRGWTLRDMGRWDEAEREVREILALAEEESYDTITPWIRLFRGQLAGLRGDLAEAERHIHEAQESAGREVWWRLHFAGHAHAALAWVRAEAGDREGARRAVQDAFAASSQHHCHWCGDSVSLVGALVEAMAPDGDEPRFKDAIGEVRKWGTSPAKALAAAAEARWGRFHDIFTEDRLEAARRYLQRIGKPFDLAQVISEHALTLNALGKTAEGTMLIEEALRIYVELGAKRRSEEILRGKKHLKA